MGLGLCVSELRWLGAVRAAPVERRRLCRRAGAGLGRVIGLAQTKFSAIFSESPLAKKLRRFRKPFPLAFLILAVMAFLGGALYAPTNYDALSYRLPRVLHWLAENQWHWIHTIFPRLNQRCCSI